MYYLYYCLGSQVITQKPTFRRKMDMEKMDHALDFFFSQNFHQVCIQRSQELLPCITWCTLSVVVIFFSKFSVSTEQSSMKLGMIIRLRIFWSILLKGPGTIRPLFLDKTFQIMFSYCRFISIWSRAKKVE